MIVCVNRKLTSDDKTILEEYIYTRTQLRGTKFREQKTFASTLSARIARNKHCDILH